MSNIMSWSPNTTSPLDINKMSTASLPKLPSNTLTQTELEKVLFTFNANLYDMACEYIWKRSLSTLKKRLSDLGVELISDMIDRKIQSVDDDLSEYDVINIAADLGLLNSTGRLVLLQSLDVMNHFLTDSIRESAEMPSDESSRIINACLNHIAIIEFDRQNFSYNDFRNKLFNEYIHNNANLIEEISNSPYVVKRTTARTCMNLMTTKSGTELERVLANMQLVIPNIWSDLKSDDKWPFGLKYAEAVNNGNKVLVKSLKSVLEKVKGFDYVPENLRSQAFIEAANQLMSVHTSKDNFYHERQAALNLYQLGTSIPTPALNACLNAVLLCKIGNNYGVATSAQATLDDILDSITPDRWKYYFNNNFSSSRSLLYQLSYGSNNNLRLFSQIVTDYNITADTTDKDSNYIIQSAIDRNPTRINIRCKQLYNQLIQNN